MFKKAIFISFCALALGGCASMGNFGGSAGEQLNLAQLNTWINQGLVFGMCPKEQRTVKVLTDPATGASKVELGCAGVVDTFSCPAGQQLVGIEVTPGGEKKAKPICQDIPVPAPAPAPEPVPAVDDEVPVN